MPVDSPLGAQTSEQRSAAERQLKATVARACMNLGVMHAQAQRFSRAAELFADAAVADPEFPQVQYSLGVAHFTAQQYDQATAPLTRALTADPRNVAIRRMLGLAWFQVENYTKAAELLEGDPERESKPSLQFAYAMALVRAIAPSRPRRSSTASSPATATARSCRSCSARRTRTKAITRPRSNRCNVPCS